MKDNFLDNNIQTKLFSNKTENEINKFNSAPRSFLSLKEHNNKKEVCQEKKRFSTQAISDNFRNIDIFSNLVKISKSNLATKKTVKEVKKRGVITNFSDRSRHRMQKLIAMLEVDKLDFPIFNTLTFHNLSQISASKSKYFLAQYCKKIKRIYPESAWIWRMEYQKRGTIHFHLILFLSTKNKVELTEYKKNQLNSFWHSVTREISEHHLHYGCHFTKIKDFKHLMIYVSKYTCKIDNSNQTKQDGRHWGKSQNLPINPVLSIKVSLQTETQFRRFLKRLWKSKHKKQKYFGDKVNHLDSFSSFVKLDTSIKILSYLISNEVNKNNFTVNLQNPYSELKSFSSNHT